MSWVPRLPTWRMPSGPAGAITDVPGVRVGHASVVDASRGVATGVTVVVPPDVESRPLPAAGHVINGYGKSAGLIQIGELGTLESVIAFSSVFAAPGVQSALLRRRLAQEPDVGGAPTGRSVNLVVLECNDAFVNDPREHTCGEGELAAALDAASEGPVAEGTVGAGTGMSTFGMAGGFGTASRMFETGEGTHHLGVALVSNFGVWGDLTVGGQPVQLQAGLPTELADSDPAHSEVADAGTADAESAGSVVIVVATDAPLDSAALRRVAVRAQNGLARTGCVTSHRSGELVLAFSATTKPVNDPDVALLNSAFRAVAEAVEEAVLSGLAHADPVVGREGRRLPVLREVTRARLQVNP
ncbi:P1 family peptidase [Knoellia sp. S7-12]|uniref:P1 family peptidase n=1 Tax=Knoellia sp. S7-12 TaxID=3126698 RepID=UPI00336729AC